jgi:uncharacterized protein (TIGR02246 family)
MTSKTLLVSACALFLVAGGLALTVPARAADDDTAAVKKRTAEFVAAWGKHDPKALAAVWADDGDLINPWGRLATGRAQVEALFRDEQTGKGPLRDSTFRMNSETMRFPAADIAVVDLDLTITGAYAPDGTKAPALEMHAFWVSKKSGGTWSVYSCRPYIKQPAAPPAVK